jgi:HD-GYP domain-containing protein (c-di-GMP phosphodiesterase class II)
MSNNLSTELLEKFSEIGLKLTAEKDVNKLLELILTECIKITDSDAGSIYIKEQVEEDPQLIFMYTLNTSMSFPFKSFKLPISMNSIAGACAMTGEIYNFKSMSDTLEILGFHHNRSFDESYGYETCNMLVIPLKNYNNDMIGVLQLINKKTDPTYKFVAYSKDFTPHVIPYDLKDEKIVGALASQAAMLIERGILFKDIENLLDSMIDTLVTALDRRDPITAGHSKRVATYALALAKTINTVDYGAYKDFTFSDEALKELYIAGMLHDVGKIGVREYVLMKRNKLSDDSIDRIRWRYKYIRKLLEDDPSKSEIWGIVPNEIDEALKKMEAINLGGFLKDEDKAFLDQFKDLSLTDLDGSTIPFLTPDEYEFMSVVRGNLTNSERKEINDHAVHTLNILTGIEWTRNLKLVPQIAADHHEKLNGYGYPNGKKAEELEIGSRILAVADVFDALTAKDRPYKPAIPIDKSIEILEDDASKGGLDPELVAIFKNERAYERI